MGDGPLVASAPAPASNVAKTLYLKGEKGISIQGAMVKSGDGVEVVMDIANANGTPTQALAVQLEKNVFGLAPVSNQLSLPSPIANGSMVTISMPLKLDPTHTGSGKSPSAVHAAFKNMASGEIIYFFIPVQLEALIVAGATPDASQYASSWKSLGADLECSCVLSNIPTADISAVKNKLTVHGVSVVAERAIPGTDQTAVYFGVRLSSGGNFLLEIKFKAGANLVKVTVKSPAKDQSEAVRAAVERILKF